MHVNFKLVLQSHTGIFNLCIVVLVAVNSRLIIENLMKVTSLCSSFALLFGIGSFPSCWFYKFSIMSIPTMDAKCNTYNCLRSKHSTDIPIPSDDNTIFFFVLQYGLLISSGFWFSSRSLRDWPLLMCW